MDIGNKVQKYISEKFLQSSDKVEIENDDSLLESGILDSAGIFELMVFLETEFSVAISDEEIIPDNFENISCITNLIESKLN